MQLPVFSCACVCAGVCAEHEIHPVRLCVHLGPGVASTAGEALTRDQVWTRLSMRASAYEHPCVESIALGEACRAVRDLAPGADPIEAVRAAVTDEGMRATILEDLCSID